MARGANQKLKLVCLRDLLLQRTDENHPMTIEQMQQALGDAGIEVRDRKSLYDDLEALRLYGMDIVGARQGRGYGYYVGQRAFELAELKLLVDAAQASRFITPKKTAQLIAKVEGLTSVHQARQLSRQVYVAGRVKTMNESIYYNVDRLHEAITAGRQIRFRYYEWTLAWGREKVARSPRRQGAPYTASPWALCWADENYYLVAYDGEARIIKHYRVDKMQDIQVLQALREGGEQMAGFDIADYAGRMFGMFGGELSRVKIHFANRLIGVVADRFGKEVFLTPEGEDHFAVTVDVAVSPQFLSWVIGFGREARVLAPKAVGQKVQALAREALAQYEE